MTGPEHYQEAERLLAESAADNCASPTNVQRALAHLKAAEISLEVAKQFGPVASVWWGVAR